MTSELARAADNVAPVMTDDTVDELAELMFEFDPGGRTTAQVTREITRIIVTWAQARGWTARTEARVEVPGLSAASRSGYVDVLVLPGGGRPCVAIEIDSADKPWSLEKLRHAAAAGMRPIWIRWGDHEWASGHADVDVIQLPAQRRPARTGIPAELSLWP